MGAINIAFHQGPQTFRVAEPIKGGQVIALNDTGEAVVAAADAENVIGVAHTDAAPRNTTYPGISIVPLPEVVGAVYAPAAVWLEIEGATGMGGNAVVGSAELGEGTVGGAETGNLSFGDKLGVGADGKVKAHSAGAIIGTATAFRGTRVLVRLAV